MWCKSAQPKPTYIYIFLIGIDPHYEAWSYKKKKHKKDYSIQKICLERTYS